MRNNRLLTWFLAGAVAVLLLAGAGNAVAAPRHVLLQLKWYHQFQFAGYYAAKSHGYYDAAGLDVDIIEGAPDRPPTSEVVDGKADFGVQDGGDLLNARLHGAPVVALAVVFQHSPYVIVSLKSKGIRTPSDLIGRVVMDRSRGSSPLLALLKREGIRVSKDGDPSAVTIRRHTWSLQDLLDGRVDAMSAYVTDEPLRLEHMGVEVSLLRPVDYGIDFYGDTLFTSEKMVASDPAMVEAFRAASMRGWDYAMAHPEELADQIVAMPTANANRMSRDMLLEEAKVMQRMVMPSLVELGHMNPGRWERMAQELVNMGEAANTSRLAGFLPDPTAGERRRAVLLNVLGYGLGGVLLLAVASLVWAQQLRSKVRQRTSALEKEVALRERKTRQLTAAEQKTRAILAALPDQVFVMRRDGTVLDYHSRAASDADQQDAEPDGEPASDVLPEEVSADIRRLFDDEPRAHTMFVHDVVAGTGAERRVLETRTVPLGDDQLVSVVRDITDQKHMQERLALLAAAVEQAAEDIIITNADRIIQYVNPAFEATTGYSSDEVVGQHVSILRSGKHDAAFYEELYAALAGGETWRGQLTNRTKDGRPVLQDATIVAIRDAEGRTTGYVSAQRDVTARVELEARVAQSERMQAIGTLAGGIAHDFNNVLGGVIGYTELALAVAGNPPEIVEDLQQVLRAARRAAELTRKILAFSRGLPDDAQPVRVQTVLEDALKLVRATIPSSVEVTLLSSSEAHARLAPGDLERIVINLCTNSSLAIGPNPGHIEVSLEDAVLDESSAALRVGLSPGRYVLLSVADDGCGMTEEVQRRLFEPFFTTRTGGQGTGLGLSVVHGIVRSRGGNIQVHSEPNRGARFDVWLPVARPKAPEPAVEPRTPAPGTGRIVFVDDEEMLTSVFRIALEHAGYRVDAYNSSTEALRAIESGSQPFDLLVTDLAMPKLRGDELASRVKALRPDAHVLLCTGNDVGLDAAALATAGVDQVLRKPITVAQMVSAIQSVLGDAPTAD